MRTAACLPLVVAVACLVAGSAATRAQTTGVTLPPAGVGSTAPNPPGTTRTGAVTIPTVVPPGPVPAGPPGAASLQLGELPQVPGAAPTKFVPRAACPSGYVQSKMFGRDTHLIVCEVKLGQVDMCATHHDSYACGRNGAECCPKRTDNSCFAGAYACPAPGAAPGQPRTACCLSR